MTFEQWWDSPESNLYSLKEIAQAAWNAALADRDSRTENAPTVEQCQVEVLQRMQREAFLSKAKYLGYSGMQEYITAQAQMYDVPLDVARSCFMVGSYPEAFGGFIDELKKYKLTKKGAMTCYQE